MVDWTASFLPKAEADLAHLVHGKAALDLETALRDEFSGMKAERLDKLFRQGVSTSSLDKLDGSRFPGSIRLQAFADYRATALCLPKFRQAYITHLFHKSSDPHYRKAVTTHDARASEFIGDFISFLNRAK